MHHKSTTTALPLASFTRKNTAFVDETCIVKENHCEWMTTWAKGHDPCMYTHPHYPCTITSSVTSCINHIRWLLWHKHTDSTKSDHQYTDNGVSKHQGHMSHKLDQQLSEIVHWEKIKSGFCIKKANHSDWHPSHYLTDRAWGCNIIASYINQIN